MKVIDCGACIGYGAYNREIINHEKYPVYEKVRQLKNADELLEEMDFCGVSESYVYHQTMIDLDPGRGNRAILDEVSKRPRLHPVWTVLPPITEPAFAPEELFPAMRENGVAALRAYPQWNRYVLCRVTMGELLDALCQRGVPLYLSPSAGWEYLYDVLKEFPGLTVIVTNWGLWGSDRYIYPLMRAYRNVYLDTSDYQMLSGIAHFVGRFGSERLLFGSNLPMDAVGGPLCAVLGAEISGDDRKKLPYEGG